MKVSITIFGIIIFLNTVSTAFSRNGSSLPGSNIHEKFLMDTTGENNQKEATGPIIKKKHNPKIATLRSAILPGLGQAYNREYWKIPIVYGALAIPTITYLYNNTWYKRTRDAYNIKINNDTAHFANIYPILQNVDPSALQTYRNSFRKDRDYSILWFMILWGLNVVDATVYGHLKDFDVSNNLSLHIEPTYNPMLSAPGLSFTFSFRNKHNILKPLPDAR
ncbi:MAG: hypothetical protein EKK39_15010 [Sphingobacteriales bacterium]|uniref:DUF5683 domain-containing protein n=1 Tax=Hydrotalea flava TaxID=714549 RepID=UPI00082D6D8B|nr:DUF5683 domain-containing protein [Hydrotalea flava]RTL47219.1 MAG: hypothetical protein EKK39_15010 [Sphingobacteriales bacterium]